ncbi:hypothetical protein ABPG75_005438 [Micractinium tetrahymenae]
MTEGHARQCVLVPHANAEGQGLQYLTDVPALADCCSACTAHANCTVFVYCPASASSGCDDGAGTIYPSSLCALKSYSLRPGQAPKFYSRGPIVPWTSGYTIS